VTNVMSAPRIRVDMLGGVSLHTDDTHIDRFRTHKTAALLAFLAYHRHQPHARETVIEMFWPDLSPEAGRNSLSITLSSLRHLLEPVARALSADRVVLAGRTSVQFNPALLTTDAALFEANIRLWERKPEASVAERRAWLEEAVRLYRGPLLPGYYQDWIPLEQTRLEALCLTVLRELARLRREAGEIEGAIEALNRAVALDSLREETQHDLIQLLLSEGRPAIALRQYRQFEQTLQTQLGIEPDDATRELVAHLAGHIPVARPTALTPQLHSMDRVASETAESGLATGVVGIGHLPPRFDRFFGREREIAQLLEQLSANARLLTITGVGGVGKTRLAVETAEILAASRPVLFLPLADVNRAEGIAETLRRTLELPMGSPEETLRGIVTSLGLHPMVLILDNFEQLLPEGAPFVRELLVRLPDLQCLVTSRRRLLLDAEQEFPLEPLSPPSVAAWDSPEKPTLETLLRSSALALFVDRARAHRAGFELTSRNASALIQLVQNLEGLPLALELAAARAAILTPRQMVDSLAKQPFELLATRRPDKVERHRSLRETILWSYRLLPTPVQDFFRHLAVFRGGWTLEAAQAVTADPATLDHLAQLRDASLLLTQEDIPTETVRFDMLVSLRAFAAELFDADPECKATQRRHADYYTALLEVNERLLHGPLESAALQSIERDYENVRAAFYRLCAERDDNRQAVRVACALTRFWLAYGDPREGIDWIEAVLQQGGLPKREQAQALQLKVRLKSLLGVREDLTALQQESLRLFWEIGDERSAVSVLCEDYADRAALEEGAALARHLGEERSLAVALSHLGSHAWQGGDSRKAEACYRESIAIMRQCGDDGRCLGTTQEWAYMLIYLGEYREAERRLAEARQLGTGRSGDWHSHLDWMCGVVATHRGAYAQALAYLEQSATTRRRFGACQALGTTLQGLGNLHITRADYAGAHAVLAECVSVWQALDSPTGLFYARCSQARLALYEGQSAQAQALFEESLTFFRETTNVLGSGTALHGLGLVALHAADWRTAETRFQEGLQERWPLRLARGCIENLYGLALAAAGQGDWERFLVLAGATESWRERIGLVLPPVENAPLSIALVQARLALREEAADQHFQAGAALSSADAVALALERSATLL
jgi:predicted ATPase/DNA-binding SARP family transcriptional activator